MDWLVDYVEWCLHSLAGWVLLGLSAVMALLVVVGLLRGAHALGAAFVRGWQTGG